MKKITMMLVFALFSLTSNAQFPENFETSVPPSGWFISTGTNNLGSSSNWRRVNEFNDVTGVTSYTAFVTSEDVSGGNAQDWLATPQFTPNSSANILKFQQKQEFSSFLNTTYTVRVSTTSQTDLSSFVIVDTQTEGGFGTSFSEHTVDLSAYNGTPIYVAFVMEQDNGDYWYIDNVSLEATTETPNCVTTVSSPVDAATDVKLTFNRRVTLSWEKPSTGTSPEGYEFYFGTTSGNLTSLGNLSSNGFVTVINTQYNTTYYWRVVPFNSVGAAIGCSTEWSFTTEPEPTAQIPFYEETFEDSFPNWQLAQGFYGSPTGTTAFPSFVFRFDDYANNASNTKAATVNIYGGVTRTYVVSPRFDLSGTNYYLNFDIALTQFQSTAAASLGAGDYVALLLTEDYGTTWTELTRWNSTTPISATGQAASEIQLSGYGDNVRLAFYYYSGSSADTDFFIENFSITDTTASVDGATKNKISVYPTIVEKDLNVRANDIVDKIEVYNLLGQQVMSSEPKQSELSVDLDRLKSGIYLVRIFIGNSTSTYRVIKKD